MKDGYTFIGIDNFTVAKSALFHCALITHLKSLFIPFSFRTLSHFRCIMDTEPLDIFKVPLCRSYVTAVAQKNRIMRQFNSEESAPKRKRRYKKRKPTRHPDYCVCGALLADGKCEILTVNRVEFCSVRDYPLYRKARDKNNEDVRKYRYSYLLYLSF